MASTAAPASGIPTGVRIKGVVIDPEVAGVLRDGEAEGTIYRLPDRQLPRDLYVKVNKVLEALGGSWSRKLKAHIGPPGFGDDLLKALDVGFAVDERKTLSFFPTPKALAERAAKALEAKAGDRVLEPSAGDGALIEALLGLGKVHEADIVAVEVSGPRCRALRVRWPAMDTECGDFLTLPRALSVNRVLMNPPYDRTLWRAHVEQALRVLRPGGRLVAILPISAEADERLQAAAEAAGTVGFTSLPEGSFSESGTEVRTTLLTVDVRRAAAAAAPQGSGWGGFRVVRGKEVPVVLEPTALENMIGRPLSVTFPADLGLDRMAQNAIDPEAASISIPAQVWATHVAQAAAHDRFVPSEREPTQEEVEFLWNKYSARARADVVAELRDRWPGSYLDFTSEGPKATAVAPKGPKATAYKIGDVVRVDGGRKRFVVSDVAPSGATVHVHALSGAYAGSQEDNVAVHRLSLDPVQVIEFSGSAAIKLQRAYEGAVGLRAAVPSGPPPMAPSGPPPVVGSAPMPEPAPATSRFPAQSAEPSQGLLGQPLPKGTPTRSIPDAEAKALVRAAATVTSSPLTAILHPEIRSRLPVWPKITLTTFNKIGSADPAGLGRFISDIHTAEAAVLWAEGRLEAAGWDPPGADEKALRRAVPEALLTIARSGLRPENVSILPDGKLRKTPSASSGPASPGEAEGPTFDKVYPHLSKAIDMAREELQSPRCGAEEREHASGVLKALEKKYHARYDAMSVADREAVAKGGWAEDPLDPWWEDRPDLLAEAPDVIEDRAQTQRALSLVHGCAMGQISLLGAHARETAARSRAPREPPPAQAPSAPPVPEAARSVAAPQTGPVLSIGGTLLEVMDVLNAPTGRRFAAVALRAAQSGAPGAAKYILARAALYGPQGVHREVRSPRFTGDDIRALISTVMTRLAGEGVVGTANHVILAALRDALPRHTLTRIVQSAEALSQDPAAGEVLRSLDKKFSSAVFGAVDWYEKAAETSGAVRGDHDRRARRMARAACDVLWAALTAAAGPQGLPAGLIAAYPPNLTAEAAEDMPPGDLPVLATAAEAAEAADAAAAHSLGPSTPVGKGPEAPSPQAMGVAASVPTEADIASYLTAADGDLKEAARLLRSAFGGWDDPVAFMAAVASWARNLASKAEAFALRWTTAPEALDVSGGSALDRTWTLGLGPAGGAEGAAWRRTAVPKDRLDEQAGGWIQAGYLVYTEAQFSASVSPSPGPSATAAVDDVLPSVGPEAGRYYVARSIYGPEGSPGEEEGFSFTLDGKALTALRAVQGGTLILAQAADGSLFIRLPDGSAEGRVAQDLDAEDRFVLTADIPEEAVDVLREIERLGLATCGSGLCLSDVIEAVAGGDPDPADVARAIEVSEGVWTEGLSGIVGAELVYVGARTDDREAVVDWLEDGDARGELTLRVRPEGRTWTLRYQSPVTGFDFTAEGVLRALEALAVPSGILDAFRAAGEAAGFVNVQATDVSAEAEAEAMASAAVAAGGLPETAFQAILGGLAKLTVEALRATASEDVFLSGSAAFSGGST